MGTSGDSVQPRSGCSRRSPAVIFYDMQPFHNGSPVYRFHYARLRMRTSHSMTTRSVEALLSTLAVLLAASCCQAAGVNQTGTSQAVTLYHTVVTSIFNIFFRSCSAGVNSTELQVVASQPNMVSCDAPSPLGQYDKYCEGLQADYFLLPKQKKAPSLTGLTPNMSTYVTSLNNTVQRLITLSLSLHTVLYSRSVRVFPALLRHWLCSRSDLTPCATVQAAALSFKGVNALIAAKTYSFAVRYTGVLFIDTAGQYDFSLDSPAGTRLTVNGNTVTFDQGSNARYVARTSEATVVSCPVAAPRLLQHQL